MGSIPVDACAVCISVQKVHALPWKEFHAALMLSYRNLGDAERSLHRLATDKFVLDSLFALQFAVVK